MLSDEQVRAYGKVLVRDNTAVVAVEMTESVFGRGGTNREQTETQRRFAVADIADGDCVGYTYGVGIPCVGAVAVRILAVVEDVVYLETPDGIVHLRPGETYRRFEEEIAYDTGWSFYVSVRCAGGVVLYTPLGRYEGEAVFGVPQGRGTLTFYEGDPLGRVQLTGHFLRGRANKVCKMIWSDGSRRYISYADGVADTSKHFVDDRTVGQCDGYVPGDIVLVSEEDLAANPHGAYFAD